MYRCHEQEFIPTPRATEELAETVAQIKAETTPFEFVGDVGDVMLVSAQSARVRASVQQVFKCRCFHMRNRNNR